jgi:hypothetical protein
MLNDIDELYETTNIKNYIEEIICKNHNLTIEYVYMWITHLLFKPYKPIGTMLNLYSKQQGTGKTLFCVLLKNLIGTKFWIEINGFEDLFKDFNANFMDKLIVVISEANKNDLRDTTYTRAKKDKLKSIMTQTEKNITFKGKDTITTDNLHNLIATTNNALTGLDNDDGQRRNVFIEVSDIKKGDFKYWNKLGDEVEDKVNYKYKQSYSLIYLYFYLKKHYLPTLNDFNFENIPVNDYSIEVKKEGARAEIKFWEILFNELDDEYEIVKSCLYENKPINNFSDLNCGLKTFKEMLKHNSKNVFGLYKNDLYNVYKKILKEELQFTTYTTSTIEFYKSINELNEKSININIEKDSNKYIKTGFTSKLWNGYEYYIIYDLNFFLNTLSSKHHLKFNRLQEETKQTFNFNL